MKNFLLLFLLFILAGQRITSASLTEDSTSAKVYTNHYHPGNLYPEMSEYELELTVRGSDISSVTAEGPNVPPTPLEYEESMSGEWKWTVHAGVSVKPLVGDIYEFHVIYNDSSTEELTASVNGVVEEFPTIISPVHGSTITTTIPRFEWTPLSIGVRSFSIMVIDLTDGIFLWNAEDLIDSTAVFYNFDAEGESLEPGKRYLWIIFYSDINDYSHGFVFSEFTIGAEVITPSISGEISYTGTSNGPILVGAFTNLAFSGEPVYYIELSSLGSYTLPGLADGIYYVASVMIEGSDSDEDVKMTDPWGVYGTWENPTSVTITDGIGVSGIDITLVDGTEENPNPFYEKYAVELWSSNWHYGGNYIVDFKVRDPDHEATSAEVTGVGITGSFSLVYDSTEAVWKRPGDNILDFQSNPPAPPLTYTFTIIDSSGTTVVTDIVETFVNVYATDLSPSGGETITGPLVFSWSFAHPGYTHWIRLFDAEGNELWGAFQLNVKSVIYDGPELPSGELYNYEVAVLDEYDNQSFSQESFVYQAVVGVEEESIPAAFYLSQNYPNPFNPATIIQYSIPVVAALSTSASASTGSALKFSTGSVEGLVHSLGESGYTNVQLKVYDILGREVATLVNKHQRPGHYKVTWDASNLSGGVYFYTLSAGKYFETKKMLMLK